VIAVSALATPAVGERVELARYCANGQERVLYGQRIDGHVRVTDCPLTTGRSYLVESNLEQEGIGAHAALKALVADYLRQAAVLDAVPMARSLLAEDLDRIGS
jgi:hypothetical protein